MATDTNATYISPESAAQQLERFADDLRMVGGRVRFSMEVEFAKPSDLAEFQRLHRAGGIARRAKRVRRSDN